MNKSFWEHKKVLITGDTGFKGAWLAFLLNQLGAVVQGFSSSKFNNNIKLYNSLTLESMNNTIDADIRDSSTLEKAFNSFQPDCIFHLAAQPLVRESYSDPVSTYDINVMGTLNILEAIRKSSSVQSAVLITTDKCYENNEWEWGYRENDPLGGHDPYSSSKGCAEILIKSYQKSFFYDLKNSPGVSSARAGNVIGGGDFSSDRLIPDLYHSIIEKNAMLLRNPLATRPWQHVLEPISGYLMIAEQLFDVGSSGNDSWNFGPQLTDIRTVQEVSELFCNNWGGTDSIQYDKSNNQPHEAKSLSLDISKAFFNLKWTPKWNLEDAVQKTAFWYKAFFERKNMINITAQQIEEYFSS